MCGRHYLYLQYTPESMAAISTLAKPEVVIWNTNREPAIARNIKLRFCTWIQWILLCLYRVQHLLVHHFKACALAPSDPAKVILLSPLKFLEIHPQSKKYYPKSLIFTTSKNVSLSFAFFFYCFIAWEAFRVRKIPPQRTHRHIHTFQWIKIFFWEAWYSPTCA